MEVYDMELDAEKLILVLNFCRIVNEHAAFMREELGLSVDEATARAYRAVVGYACSVATGLCS